MHRRASRSRPRSNPFGGLKLWGNVAFVQSRFVDFSYVDGNGVSQSYSGKTPPNVPSFVANAGASYRFATAWPVEIGASLRHVGDRFNFQDNLVTMDRLHDRGRLCVRRYSEIDVQ